MGLLDIFTKKKEPVKAVVSRPLTASRTVNTERAISKQVVKKDPSKPHGDRGVAIVGDRLSVTRSPKLPLWAAIRAVGLRWTGNDGTSLFNGLDKSIAGGTV